MTKRPVAFRVPRMDCAGTHASTRDFRLFSDEGEARAAAESIHLGWVKFEATRLGLLS